MGPLGARRASRLILLAPWSPTIRRILVPVTGDRARSSTRWTRSAFLAVGSLYFCRKRRFLFRWLAHAGGASSPALDEPLTRTAPCSGAVVRARTLATELGAGAPALCRRTPAGDPGGVLGASARGMRSTRVELSRCTVCPGAVAGPWSRPFWGVSGLAQMDGIGRFVLTASCGRGGFRLAPPAARRPPRKQAPLTSSATRRRES